MCAARTKHTLPWGSNHPIFSPVRSSVGFILDPLRKLMSRSNYSQEAIDLFKTNTNAKFALNNMINWYVGTYVRIRVRIYLISDFRSLLVLGTYFDKALWWWENIFPPLFWVVFIPAQNPCALAISRLPFSPSSVMWQQKRTHFFLENQITVGGKIVCILYLMPTGLLLLHPEGDILTIE